MFRKYGAILLGVGNILGWIIVYLNDIYQLEFYLTLGAPIIALCSLVWTYKKPDVQLKKWTIALNVVFLLLFTAFWTYVILLGIGINSYPH
ncbi:hypothetical protein [Wukongibacter sp. M2B1]|uniref:hypothetical protein n=1 Tax=Wukongibacter sp. M2B1 TaxID=3088895 RepID=UPI003D7AF188